MGNLIILLAIILIVAAVIVVLFRRRKAKRRVARVTKGSISAQWVEAGKTLTIAGHKINGMVYIGREHQQNHQHWQGGVAIDPQLPVAEVAGDLQGRTISRWPSYSRIEPSARTTYLNWLANGRSQQNIGVGYIFLFFYGLEYRFFIDKPSRDERIILAQEAKRLLDSYGSNKSVDRYLGVFHDVAQLTLHPEQKRQPVFENLGHGVPISVRATIGKMINERQPLTAEWLLSWYINCSETRLHPLAKHSFAEFKELFSQLFTSQYRQGLAVTIPEKIGQVVYLSASARFFRKITYAGHEVPDIASIREPIAIANKFANEAIDLMKTRAKQQSPNYQQSPQDHNDKQQSILDDVFDDDDNEQQPDNSPLLDNQHAGLLDELLSRPRWSRDESTELARQHRLMPEGAIETINNFAIEVYQEPLVIEDDNYLVIEQDIANRINSGGKNGNN